MTEYERHILQLQKRNLPKSEMLSPLQPKKEIIPSPMLLPFTLPNPLPVEKCQFHLMLATQNSTPAKELAKCNVLLRPDLRERSPQTILFQTRQGQNKPGSAIGAGDLRSRFLHFDLHAELHHVENTLSDDSAPYSTRLAQNSFAWRAPSQKISKAVAPRDTNQLFWGDTEGLWFWFRFRLFRRRAV